MPAPVRMTYLGITSIPRPMIEAGEAYFLHSFHFAATDPHHVAAMTDHGEGLVAAVARANILGVQFHPEKSQNYGLATLRRFLEWYP
jgi:glutamine amidotransferase